MPAESGSILAAHHVPQLDRVVPTTRRGQGLAVWSEGHGKNPFMPAESGSVLAAVHVPKFDRVIASRGKSLAVRTESHGLDRRSMPLEGIQQFGLLGRQRRQRTQPQT